MKTFAFGSKAFSTGVDRSRLFRGKTGITYVIRVMDLDISVVRQHRVALPPGPAGNDRGFTVNCAKTWKDGPVGNEDHGSWEGKCLACERGLQADLRFCVGIVVVGEQNGRAPMQPVDPANSVRLWDFGPARQRALAERVESLAAEGKKINEVELVVKCSPEGNAEKYQKLLVERFEGVRMTKREHVEAYKAEIKKIKDDFSRVDSPDEMARRLQPPRDRNDQGGVAPAGSQVGWGGPPPARKPASTGDLTADALIDGMQGGGQPASAPAVNVTDEDIPF